MGRGSTQILIRKIMECLAKGPKSATEISEETGLDRTAIARYLDVLRESDFIVEEQDGTSKKFILTSKYRLDTYFGLPLSDEVNKQIDSLYNLIEKKWKEIAQRKLLKTTAQKIIYQVIHDCNLKIPTGWYIYGGVCVKPYDYDMNYDFQKLDEKTVRCVHETVAEYAKILPAYGHKQNQYQKVGKELYTLKEDILKLLYSKNFSKNSMYVFQKLFRKLSHLAPKGDKLYTELVNEYDTLLIDITRHWDDFIDENDELSFAEFKQRLTQSFEALWKMLAMYNFKNDLRTSEFEFYLDKELDEHFKFDIAQAKEELIERGSELNEMIPFEEPDDPLYQQIKSIRKNAKPTDPEKLRKQNEEIDRIEREEGSEAMQKELRRRAGLE